MTMVTITLIRSAPIDSCKYRRINQRLSLTHDRSIAEAMGRSLQQTSISTNIKERLDYSCALFSPTGDLVANAP